MVRPIASLTLTSLILHQVPRAWKHSSIPSLPLVYSGTPVKLDVDQRLYMQERLHSSLSLKGQAREVQEVSDHSSPVPDFIRHLLLHPTSDFIKASQAMADHLRSVQDGGSPDGLFLFARCNWNRQPAVLVAKVELEKGMQVIQTMVDGLATYDITVLKNLIFGQTSKIFKVGLFSVEDLDPKSNFLRGIAIDEQKGGSGVTKLFLLDYLGCEYVADAAENTRKFYEGATKYFSESVSDPRKKGIYMMALITELTNRNVSINPSEFARTHLNEEHQHPFLNSVGREGVPTGTFTKALDYVPTHFIQYETETNILIIADQEEAKRSLVVQSDSVLVKGGLKKVSGRGLKGPAKVSDLGPVGKTSKVPNESGKKIKVSPERVQRKSKQ